MIHRLHKKWLNHLIHIYEEKKVIIHLQEELKQYRNKYHATATSKLVLWFMLILLLAIVIFTGYVTIKMMTIIATIGGAMDFTPLVALISAMIGQVIITLGYFAKSTKENSEGGVTYLAAQHQLQEQDEMGGVG
ncbi:MAG: hypothetical protein IJ093_04245 [Bacilli bacterium]|nr:hypothetical protein [Bacilli bacterium]